MHYLYRVSQQFSPTTVRAALLLATLVVAALAGSADDPNPG
jgi:hypothetical protein